MSNFGISITSNATTAYTWDGLEHLVSGLRFTTVIPGGCGEASCRLDTPTSGPFVIPEFIRPNYRFDITRNGRYVWSGRLEAPHLHFGDSGAWWELVARGYGVVLSDAVTASTNARNTLSSTVVSNAVAGLSSFGTTTITATGFTFTNTADITLSNFTTAQIISWAARFGDTSYNPQVWYVYPQDNGTVEFTFGPRPSAASVTGYVRDFDGCTFGYDMQDAGNKATIAYTGGNSSQNNTTLQGVGPDGWNFTKELLRAIPELTNATDAAQAAQVLLTNYQNLRMAASSPMTYKRGRGFDDANQYNLDPWFVRSGFLMQFVDIESADFVNSFLIAGTQYDEDSQTLTITPESYAQLIDQSVATVEAVLSGVYAIG